MSAGTLLEIGDFTLWGVQRHRALPVCALCQRPAQLLPRELELRFDAERWMDWQQTTFNRAGGPAFLQLIRTT